MANFDQMPRMPLLYRVPAKNEDRQVIGANSPAPEQEYWVVQLSVWDYKSESTTWQNDPLLGDVCMVPDTDLYFEQHKFYTEKDALVFIRYWWINHSAVELIDKL